MKNLRKKLLVSIFTLMIAVVAVATTTYAWFTLGTSTTVSNIELGATGNKGFSIRVLSINTNKTGLSTDYTSEISLKDNALISNVKLVPLTMKERLGVTDLSTVTFAKQGLYTLDRVEGGVPIYSEDPVSVTGVNGDKFLVIEFGFYSNTENLNISIDSIVSAPKLSDYSFVSPIALTGQNGVGNVDQGANITMARLANAIRVAVRKADSFNNATINYGTNKYQLIKSTITAKDKEADKKSYGTWYDTTLATGGAQYFNSQVINKLTIGNVPAEYTYDFTEEATMKSTTVATLNTKVSESDKSAYYAALQVMVWLEGWDADCFDAVQLDSLNLQFNFKINA